MPNPKSDSPNSESSLNSEIGTKLLIRISDFGFLSDFALRAYCPTSSSHVALKNFTHWAISGLELSQ